MIEPDAFKEEVRLTAREMKVKPKEIHVRFMTRRWASCSKSGRVTFSRRLLSKPADFRKEVIVHELLHLIVPNHGKMFKALERSYLREEGKRVQEN